MSAKEIPSNIWMFGLNCVSLHSCEDASHVAVRVKQEKSNEENNNYESVGSDIRIVQLQCAE